MQTRALGKTGAELSVIGFGGIVVKDVSPSEAQQYVTEAIERGVNYFDVAPTYGNAEERLGPALEQFRKDVFLACKTGKKNPADIEAELENSLKTLRTDYFDLYQFHGVSSVEQAEDLLAPGRGVDTLVRARENGLIRNIGFSAHSRDAALLLLEEFDFDTMLFPINMFCWHQGHIGPAVCAKAVQNDTGVLALKSLAKRPLQTEEKKKWPKCWYVPIDTLQHAKTALSFTLSQPVTAAVCPSHMELFRLACDAAEEIGEDPANTPEITQVQGRPIFSASGEMQ